MRSAQANEERWQSDLNKVRAELATSEAEKAQAALRAERELTEARERCRSAEDRAHNAGGEDGEHAAAQGGGGYQA